MDINILFKTIKEASSRMKLKEINEAVEELNSNNSNLALFLTNNNVVNPVFGIVQTLIDVQTKLTELRVPLNLVKNVYDQYTIIFVICMLEQTKTKSERNSVQKMLIEILSNSGKFDIFTKINKNTKLVSGRNSIINECFWIIPIFSNVKFLTSTFNHEKFVSEMVSITAKSPDFGLGYEYYVTGNLSNMDKSAYKLFLTEGIKTLQI